MSFKHDGEKVKVSLLLDNMAAEVMDVAAVLQYGNDKYYNGEGWDAGWQCVPDAQRRYSDALYRHRLAISQGELLDPESGLNHWAHVVCNALFLLWFSKNGEPNKNA